MRGDLLLDTNAVIALIRSDVSLSARIASANVFLSTIVLGELYFGAEKSNRVVENIARLDGYTAKSSVINVDLKICREYGRLHNELRMKGRPIPTNDVWIAATARSNGLTLLTRDAHFKHVDGLQTDDW